MHIFPLFVWFLGRLTLAVTEPTEGREIISPTQPRGPGAGVPPARGLIRHWQHPSLQIGLYCV